MIGVKLTIGEYLNICNLFEFWYKKHLVYLKIDNGLWIGYQLKC